MRGRGGFGDRGGGRGGFGGRGGGGRGGGRGWQDYGPPESVIEAGSFTHPCEGEAVVKLTNEKVRRLLCALVFRCFLGPLIGAVCWLLPSCAQRLLRSRSSLAARQSV